MFAQLVKTWLFTDLLNEDSVWEHVFIEQKAHRAQTQ